MYTNPVTEMEKNMKLKKYERLRQIHLDQKIAKSIFNSSRISRMTDEEMKSFEHAKEARFYAEGDQNSGLVQLMEESSFRKFYEDTTNKKLILDLVSYLLSMQLRKVVQSSLRLLSKDGGLHELGRPLTSIEIKKPIETTLRLLRNKKKYYTKRILSRYFSL